MGVMSKEKTKLGEVLLDILIGNRKKKVLNLSIVGVAWFLILSYLKNKGLESKLKKRTASSIGSLQQ